MNYPNMYKVDVPEGVEGIWAIQRFEVRPGDVRQLGNVRYVPEGHYTKLTRSGSIIMSDTPDEIRDHRMPISQIRREEQPTVLIHGLGLGMVARAALLEGASHVTVVERSPEVLKLTGPWLQQLGGERVTLIEGDAFTWTPPKGSRWDVVWHDIWDGICSDNLEEMKTLHRRFGRRSGWQGSWARYLCERQRAAWGGW